jgi:hypothetical protein
MLVATIVRQPIRGRDQEIVVPEGHGSEHFIRQHNRFTQGIQLPRRNSQILRFVGHHVQRHRMRTVR